MTQTPNVGLKKIDGSENWRNVFDYYNYSMDQADEAIAAARGGLTYVENGDTIAANANYTEGRFICWKGEIYRIKTTINATVTSANWTTYLTKQDGIGGALSQINEDLTSLNSNLSPLITGKTWAEYVQPTLINGSHYSGGCRYGKFGAFVHIYISVEFDSAPTNALLWTMPSGFIPIGDVQLAASGGGSYNAKAQAIVNISGEVKVTSVDKWVTASGIYFVTL